MKLLGIIKYITIALALGLSGITYAYGNIVRLSLIDHSSFQHIGRNLYLSDQLPNDAHSKVLALLKKARERVTTIYGTPNAEPVVVVIGDKQEQQDYGLYDHPGTLLSAPWGSYLLLDYQSMNLDVTAHELVHAEVVSRIGYFKHQTQIPTWFDEGAAMQVDFRPRYSSTNTIGRSEFKRVLSLSKPNLFWTNDSNQNVKNYQSAKLAVSEILKNSDDDLYALLARIQKGEKTVLSHSTENTRSVLQQTHQ